MATAENPAGIGSREEPLVSVVLIYFNAGKYIAEAIESVRSQSYGNWELILVDDGSIDAGAAIAAEYAARQPERIRCVRHAGGANRGMSASRNLGFRHARGEYLALIDADDVWLSGKLERQVMLLQKYPNAGMIVSPIEWWYSWAGDRAPADFVAPWPGEIPVGTVIEPPQMLAALLKRATVSTTSSLMRRALFDSTGGFEESFHGLFEDQAFAAKIYLDTPVFVDDVCCYRWRKHPESSCAVAVQNECYVPARRHFLRWLSEYLKAQAAAEPELWRTLEQELRRCDEDQRQPLALGIARLPQRFFGLGRRALQKLLPRRRLEQLRQWRYGAGYAPPAGAVDFGSLARTTPIGGNWGFDRGTPVDRYYIENFLESCAGDISGRVLEIGDDRYTKRFGNGRVRCSDVLHAVDGNPQATLVADLSRGDNLPSDSFDCIICTQTLMFIFDVQAAMRTLFRILRPGGVLLLTVAGVSHQISRFDMARWGDYWRFTGLAMRRLCETVFPAPQITVRNFGNVQAAVAFLHGLCAEELGPDVLDRHDDDYPVTIAVRAVKAAI